MRLEVYKDGEKLEFEKVTLMEYFIQLQDKVNSFTPIEIDFSAIHQMLVETNKEVAELAFQHEKKESR